MILQSLRRRRTLSASLRIFMAAAMLLPANPGMLFAQDTGALPKSLNFKAALDLALLKSVDVDPETGTLLCRFTDAQISSGKLKFPITRTWRELDVSVEGGGFRWSMTTDQRLEGLGKKELAFVDATGQRRWFAQSSNGYIATRGYPALIQAKGENFEMTGLGDERTSLFDAQGRLISITDFEGSTISFQYAGKMLASIKSKLGSLVFERNDNGSIRAIRYPNNRKVEYQYNKKGFLKRFITMNRLAWTYKYDSKDRLVTIGDDSVRVGYDQIGRVCRVSGKNVRLRRYFYLTSADPARSYITLTEDGSGRTALYAQSYDRRYIERISEEGNRTFVELDDRNRPVVITDDQGLKTEYGYDAMGRTSVIEAPNGTLTSFEYKGSNLKPSVILKGSEKWSFDFDSKQRLAAINTPTGAKQSLEYNEKGLLAKTVDHRGLKRTYEYNDLGTVSAILENGKKMQLRYDGYGRVAGLTRPDGKTAKLIYNANGQIDSVTESSGKTVSYTYNRFGLVSSHTDETGYQINYKYTRFGEIREIRDAKGLIQKYEYNKGGQLAAAIDALGNRSIYSYKGKKYIVTQPNGTQRTYEFDDKQRVRKETLPNGRKIAYDYNKQGLLKKMTLPGNKLAAFTYNKDGQLTGMANADSQFRIGYDKIGRISTLIDDKLKKAIRYGYNTAGDRTEMTLPFGKVKYVRDEYGRIKDIEDIDGGHIKIDYTFDGRRKSILYPNGVTTQFQYDTRDRLTAMITSDKAKKVLSSRTYGYDALGRRDSMTTEKGDKESYLYDARGRMTEIRRGTDTTKYAYDGADNRTSKTVNGQTTKYAIGKGNQISSSGVEKLKYNVLGQLIRKISKHGVTRYSYNAQGKLTKVEKPGAVVKYGYAPNGTRVWREVNGKRRYFLHDFSDVVAEYDAKGQLIRSYTYGPDNDDVLASHSNKSEATYFHYDAVRSVVALTNRTGAVVGRYDYDVFGSIRSKDGAATRWNPYGFTSRRRDPVAGLQYFRARYYDSSMGRFTSQDPVGYLDGPNRYAYARNNPALYNDPYGLWSLRGAWNSATSKVSSAWESTKKVASSAWETTKEVGTYVGKQTVAFGKGFGKGVWNGVKGVYTLVRHPIQTVKGVVYAIENWEQTKEAMGEMWDAYMDAMENDPEKFAEMTGMLTGELVFAIVGTKGLDKVAKVATLAKVGQGAAKVSRAAGITRAAGAVSSKLGTKVASVGRAVGTKAAKLGTAAARRFPKTAAAARVLAANTAKIGATMKKVATNAARKTRAIDRARALSRARFAARGGNIITRNARKLAAIPGNIARTAKFAVRNPGAFLTYGTYNMTRGALRTVAAIGRGTWTMGRRASIPAALIFKDEISDSINKYKSREEALGQLLKDSDSLMNNAGKLTGDDLQKELDKVGGTYNDYRNNLLKPIHLETTTFNKSLEEFNDLALAEDLDDDAILSRMEASVDAFARRRDNLLTVVFDGYKEEEHSYKSPSANRVNSYDNEIELLMKASEKVSDEASKKLIEDRIAALKEAKGIEYALYRSGDHDTLLSYLAGENVDISGSLGIPGLGGELPGTESSGMADALDQAFDDE
ncbi:MAG: hypothetical protein P1V97_00390 [Planctomycetota bacterium]|nr:hypothetical protein [Planctomycetota bacterium]